MAIKYYAWISTRGEKKHIREGAIFAGLVSDMPKKYRHLIDPNEVRKFCVINPLQST